MFPILNPLPPPSPYHPSGPSQCTSPKHPVSCIEPGLVIRCTYDIIHVSMPFSQLIPPSPSPTESKRLFYTCVSLLLSRVQGYCYYLSQFHISVLGFLSRGDREIGVLRNVEPPTRPLLECRRETGLILRCGRKVGNPFQTKQGSRPSCPDQEGRRGSEEVVPEIFGGPLEGDGDVGALCGSHQG